MTNVSEVHPDKFFGVTEAVSPTVLHPKSAVRRVFPAENIFKVAFGAPHHKGRWITHPGSDTYPSVVAYKLHFHLEAPTSLLIHLSADERYDLFLDGTLIARGPERGDPAHWFYDSFELSLSAGHHTFVARVWSLGELAPFAQMSLRHGFFLFTEEATLLLSTGTAPWQTKLLGGYRWKSPLPCAQGIGWQQIIVGDEFDWNHELGDGIGWEKAALGAYADSEEGIGITAFQPSTETHHRLTPAQLPSMRDEVIHAGRVRCISDFDSRPVGLRPIDIEESFDREHDSWQMLLDGTSSLVIPPFTRRRVIVDLKTYLCARPELLLSGGKNAWIEIDWSEALYEDIESPGSGLSEAHMWPKGNRNDIDGKFFVWPWSRTDGPGDEFHADGGRNRHFTTFWWKAGRYVQILVETSQEELIIESLCLRETGYPLLVEGAVSCSSPEINELVPLFTRGLKACAHETYMDCPFYEQLMYVGDTRIESLLTYVLTRDDRLPRKALSLFDWSRLPSGLTQSQYPSRLRQIIPPFSLWWVAMCHDYALWRGDAEFVRSLLPGVRSICDYYAGLLNRNGLIAAANGWNFTDWTSEWRPDGVPPGAAVESSGVLNWQTVMTFRMASELEQWFGENEMSSLQSRRAHDLATATHGHFWNERRSLYADDLAQRHWSEHAQCLALLSGLAPAASLPGIKQGLQTATDLAQTTIYFSHYLFEAYRVLELPDSLLSRLGHWKHLIRNGLTTPVEQPEPSRSDCHAWGAHPLFHFYATLGGIRPASPGFSVVDIHPQIDTLDFLRVKLPHPRGHIYLEVKAGEAFALLPSGVRLTERSRKLLRRERTLNSSQPPEPTCTL